ncbi:Kelch domain protein [Stigmatella aurantiaca DW4/3-1]|uniref:Kelch domain protein n=3 Tax=Stigmatella aurantiaca TaxID=41 RepID=Q08TW2_STIAD|nr:Kelch domain protein [Stigmatella aurantiaca DW4/3-1]EAU63919.1 hypothetical protein STIAU_0269 [Stigmatella aurantiaca DW4/3-1]
MGVMGVRVGWAGLLLGLSSGLAVAQPISEVGRWSPLMSWPISATHAHLLHSGKVMFFGEFDEGTQSPRLWDPLANTLTPIPAPPFNIFCAGHSFLEDGRLLITGGHVDSHVGVPDAIIFNPKSGAWDNVPDMNDKRWYPNNTTLANGDVLVLSGETDGEGLFNELPQRYVAATNSWQNLTTAQRKIPYYPHMFLAPNNKLFFSGPWRSSQWLDPDGTGTWFEAPYSHFGGRSYGGHVYFDGKVLAVGGGNPPTETVELIDLNLPSPTWAYQTPMSVARRQHNTTFLPDGKVLVTGGSRLEGFNNAEGAVLFPEVWDPETNVWKKLASNNAYRGYHSSSVLLPDGRVLSAGGRNVRTAEVFEPPYLFQGPRPVISTAPDEIKPGTPFSVGTPSGAQLKKVTLISLASVTHAFDSSQRFLTLPHALTQEGLTVTAPESNVAAPPGPYMLFLISKEGVPSVAKMVMVKKVPPRFTRVLAFSDVWKYDDTNVDRGTSWLSASYNDASWKSGPGQLGYGDGDEGTVLNAMVPAQPSVYFRKKFTLTKQVSAAMLEVLFDDGIQVWINEVPVFSRNMGKGLHFAAFASGSTNNQYIREPLPLASNPFRTGENILTAMVKQVGSSSTDLTFALGLEVETASLPSQDLIQVLSPNGGESWAGGSRATLRWALKSPVPKVDLAFSSDGGTVWTPIAFEVPGEQGTYPWRVPNLQSTQVLVRVSKTGGGSSDVSDAVFSIVRTQIQEP